MGLRFQKQYLAGLLFAGAAAMAQETAARTTPAERSDAPVTDTAPSELKTESAIYLQRRLGQWSLAEAQRILGEPRRRRDAMEEGAVTGDIYTFADPSRRYREFELLFDRERKTLRAVFIYPWHMTWDDCRELWGDEVNTTQLANGNVFRSYLSRRLDVLVDRTGAVINLGIY